MANERKMVTENIRRYLLTEYVKEETARAGFGGLDIQRTPMGTHVKLITERPGIVIGRRGSEIKKLTRDVEDRFHFDNPQIEVEEVRNPYLNAQIMAEKLANALERGWHFRRAGHSTVRNIIRAGAKGCQVILSGKLTGQRHRMEKFKSGHIKFCGEPKLKWIKEGFAVAKVKLGVIGVKVQIMDPKAKLPDDIEVFSPKKEEKKSKKDEEKEMEEAEKEVSTKDDKEESKPEKKDKKSKSKSKALKKVKSKAKNLKKQGVQIDVLEDDEELDLVKAIPPEADLEAKRKEVGVEETGEEEPEDVPKKTGTSKPKSKAEEPKPKAEEPKSKAEEPKSKAEEPKPKAEEQKSKAEEPKPKAEEPKSKAESSAKKKKTKAPEETTSESTEEEDSESKEEEE